MDNEEKIINAIHCECPNCHTKFDVVPPMNTVIKNNDVLCSCGVPNNLHGTSCGWINASQPLNKDQEPTKYRFADESFSGIINTIINA